MTAAKKTKPVDALNELEPMLTRLKLTAIRDQLDTLLDQAGRAELNLREALTMLCTAEVARKDERRIQMGMSIAKFPCVRTLEGFEYDAQPSVDPKQIRELATSRWVANGDSVLLLGPPGVGKTIWRSPSAWRRCAPARASTWPRWRTWWSRCDAPNARGASPSWWPTSPASAS